MAEVIPFKGVLYNVPKVSQVSGADLLAPPYDIITPEYKEELYRKSPYNIVRIDFGKEFVGDNDAENKYTRAKASLTEWLKDEILLPSSEPCYYCYEISYTICGINKILRGFLGLVRLEELGKGNIYPHECTHSKPKKDRLDLMSICEGNISPIFSLYNGDNGSIPGVLDGLCATSPYIEAIDPDGASHRLWEIRDRNAVSLIHDQLSASAIFIADGHHRYETAFAYQQEMREKDGNPACVRPYDYVLMFFAHMEDNGLTILPTHRLAKQVPADALERLSADFEIQEVRGNFGIANAIENKKDEFGFYTGSDVWYKLSYKGEGVPGVQSALKYLDVTVLHELIFKKLLKVEELTYEMDIAKCLQLVRTGEFNSAFFLNPTLVKDVESVALASLRMPPKSTYFYPKLLTGLVLNIFKHTF